MDDLALALRLTALYARVVYDALQFDIKPPEPFLLSRSIAAVPGQRIDTAIAGRAFTCGGEVVTSAADLDDLHRLRMLTEMTAGCVQVIAAGADRSCPISGTSPGCSRQALGLSPP